MTGSPGRCADAGIPDEVYGQHFGLRSAIEELGMSYVLAVPCNQHVIATDAMPAGQCRADELIAALPAQAWRTRSPGNGAKGQRRYAWARTRVRGINHPEATYWLLARRSLADPGDIAYYLCHAPTRTTLAELVRVAGGRWAVEETFRTAKGETGLDQYQVRQWRGWYRHINPVHACPRVPDRHPVEKRGHPVDDPSATAN